MQLLRSLSALGAPAFCLVLGVAAPVAAQVTRTMTPNTQVATATIPTMPPGIIAKAGGFMVPKAVTMQTMTPAETEAYAVWNMRAALNVAALQCQFSNFLATVKTYNAVLRNHADELARAQKTLLAHFTRHEKVKARAANAFDQFTTRTYNSYSTLDAQYNFCEAAGRIGRDVLATPRGGLGKISLLRNPDIRASLAEMPLSPALAAVEMQPLALPSMDTR